MKNVLKLKFDLTYQDITFCYGRKAFKETMKELTNEETDITHGGVCYRLRSGNKIRYIVGVIKPGRNHHITSLKALIVHELSHLTSMLMEDSGIKDDEFRSHTLQWLYEIIIPYVDNKYIKKKKK